MVLSADHHSRGTGMDALDRTIADLRAQLRSIRPASPEAVANLDRWYDVHFTYTSNALEGNTLTHSETALVIEKGITVSGKPLIHHNEAVDHYAAVQAMRDMAQRSGPIAEDDVRCLHRTVMQRSRPGIAGLYADGPRRITGSAAILPAAHKLPVLMDAFGRDLQEMSGWQDAFEAHWKLVDIHPFADGNGRTARLLMNAMLLRDGHPPVSIGPERKPAYIAALEQRRVAEPIGHDVVDDVAIGRYRTFMGERLIESLEDHLRFLQPNEPHLHAFRDM